MKEAIVSAGPDVKLVDSPLPRPGPDEILIKVVVCGTNPKDWKYPTIFKKSQNSGDDIAGLVEAVGGNVTEFHKGDRVAAFHVMGKPHGAFAEYAVAPAHTTFHLPTGTSFEDAATIPLAAMTAAYGLFVYLGLPEPWLPDRVKATTGPLLIYGGAGAVGAYAIQLAKHAGIGPIIAVAGNGIPFVESMLDKSKGDAVIDYRQGHEAVVKGIKEALPAGKKLRYCFDTVSEHNSFMNASEVLDKAGDSHITLVLPGRDFSAIPASIQQTTTMVGDAHNGNTDFAFAWFRLFSKGLREGWFKPHPHEVVKGGLAGVETGLRNLSEGKASARKYVYRVAETPGLSANL